MSGLASCELCPVYHEFLEADRAKIADAVRERFPEADSEVVELFLDHEEQFRQEILDGSVSCPGYTPLSGILKFAVNFFDGPKALRMLEEGHCENPVLHNPETIRQVKDTRAELAEKLAK